MKKFLLSIVGLFMCVAVAFSVVGCTKDYGTTTNNTSNVIANGGSTVIHNGYLYFANGVKKNDGETNGGTLGSIYKVAVDENGAIAEDAEYTKVVDSLVGYDKGSINIIGDFLYYTTPGTGKNKVGEILYNKTTFMRMNLNTNKKQEIYKTADNNADEDVKFAFYAGETENDLFLVVYESTSKTLKSFKIGNKIEETLSVENVTSAVFSDKMGRTEADDADQFIFYTMAYDPKVSVDSSTNRVYRVYPNGTGNVLLNDNANLSLLCVRAGKLLMTATFGEKDDEVVNTYAYKVTTETQNGDIKIVDETNSKNAHPESDQYVVFRGDYEDVVYLEEGNDIAVLYLADKILMYAKYNGGTTPEVSYSICTFAKAPTLSFIDTFVDEHDNNNGYVLFINKDSSKYFVYKVRYTFANQDEATAEDVDPIVLTTTDLDNDDSTSDVEFGNMIPELAGGYVYTHTQDEDKNFVLCRVNIYTPEELAEQAEENVGGESGSEGESGSGEGSGETPDGEGSEENEDDLKVGEAEIIGGADLK